MDFGFLSQMGVRTQTYLSLSLKTLMSLKKNIFKCVLITFFFDTPDFFYGNIHDFFSQIAMM